MGNEFSRSVNTAQNNILLRIIGFFKSFLRTIVHYNYVKIMLIIKQRVT